MAAVASTGEAISKVRFTEEMKGHLTFGETDFDRGDDPGRDGSTAIMFHLTIEVPDVARFLRDPRREAIARGWVGCDALGGRLPVEQGVFNLLVDDAGPATKRMLYRLFFRDGIGHPLTLSGFKTVRDDPGFDVWSDTSTLYTRVYRGHVGEDKEPSAEVVGSGIVRIRKRDFARQLTTFRADGANARARALALVRFLRLFMGQLVEVYLRKAKERVA